MAARVVSNFLCISKNTPPTLPLALPSESACVPWLSSSVYASHSSPRQFHYRNALSLSITITFSEKPFITHAALSIASSVPGDDWVCLCLCLCLFLCVRVS